MIINEEFCSRVYRVYKVLKRNIIQAIGDKKMDRKEFLKYCGLTLLSLLGFKAIINILNQPDNSIISQNDNGFGGGKYGA